MYTPEPGVVSVLIVDIAGVGQAIGATAAPLPAEGEAPGAV